MAEKKVKIGFVGCGGIANFHFGHYDNNKIPNAQIVAVCDLLDDRAQKAAERFNAKPYKCWKEMLDKEKLDALYVCVEPCAHTPLPQNISERRKGDGGYMPVKSSFRA